VRLGQKELDPFEEHTFKSFLKEVLGMDKDGMMRWRIRTNGRV
jgi:hypothetical protein